MKRYEKNVTERIKAAIEVEEDFSKAINLMVCNNGYQWSAATCYSREVVEALYEVMGDYLRDTEECNHD